MYLLSWENLFTIYCLKFDLMGESYEIFNIGAFASDIFSWSTLNVLIVKSFARSKKITTLICKKSVALIVIMIFKISIGSMRSWIGWGGRGVNPSEISMIMQISWMGNQTVFKWVTPFLDSCKGLNFNWNCPQIDSPFSPKIWKLQRGADWWKTEVEISWEGPLKGLSHEN